MGHTSWVEYFRADFGAPGEIVDVFARPETVRVLDQKVEPIIRDRAAPVYTVPITGQLHRPQDPKDRAKRVTLRTGQTAPLEFLMPISA